MTTDLSTFRRADWKVEPITVAEARDLVERYHYSKGGSNTAVYCFGLFFKPLELLTGATWWLPPTRVACESVNKEQWTRVLSLTRMVVAPWVPRNACSFMLSRSVKAIRKDRRFVTLVTYADESQGHTGAVYKSSNWNYVGRTGPYPRWTDGQGLQRAIKATRSRTKAQMQALGYQCQGSFFKHKFVLHLEPRND